MTGNDFFLMAVGGPNNRTDYHINQTEEWFYQVKGNMVIKIVDESVTPAVFRDIPLGEGDMFLLPARVPHSPQRFADTLGLVIERTRTGDNSLEDRLRWYCNQPTCRSIIYEESFICLDVGTQLKEIINRYHASDKRCPVCNCVSE
jgi:3-hydroxyanthranilate 3,4-dioxygenase